MTPTARTPTNILAIDPATKCGWSHSSGVSGVWDLSNRRDEGGGMRLVRFRGKLEEIRQNIGVDVVVYEAARHAAPRMQGALVVQSEIQGTLKLWCEEHQISYAGYSPSDIKKHATGKGNANKDAMIARAKELKGGEIADDNEADAICLLHMAQDRLRIG